MWVRCLGFALLVWIPAVLHGSSTCSGSNKIKLTFTTVDRCGEFPVVENGVVHHDDCRYLRYECVQFYELVGSAVVTCYINGTWSEAPTCRELSSSSSGSKDDSSVPSFTTIDKCGDFPVVADSVVHQDNLRFLRYECVNFYKLVGSAEVACYSDGTWSAVPSCRANYCSVNTADYVDLVNHGLAFVTNGETKRLDCKDKWRYESLALVECNDGTAKISQCCNIYQINLGLCWSRGLMTH
ncbi:beta-2-glycoprotein 1-like [Leuresthes tenuis]|uniref:beta-2-glycoprotein 1-like n=1 Tax=Leuresthes tenuis TaxID=355514 RepID=UPI003B508562